MVGRFNHGDSFREAFKGKCIKLLVSAYNKAAKEKSINLDWEENDITAQLHKYVDKDRFRVVNNIITNVEHHLADDSLPKERGFAAKYSRIDMRFVSIKNEIEYKYFAEAKLLKEKDSALKRRYIETGINNFSSGKYYDGFLVAYIVEGVLISAVNGINKLLEKDRRNSEILKKVTCNCHDEYYESVHDSIGKLKHFMFDFTSYGKTNAP